MRAHLRPAPYQVRCVQSGAAAVAAVKERIPDVVLIDILMPDMDGFELCTLLRQMPSLEHIPIVMVTALASRECVVQGLDAGADELLVKPVNGAELRARLKNLVKIKAYHDLLKAQHQQALLDLAHTQQLLQRADRLALMGTMLASVGHELNNAAAILDASVRAMGRDLRAGQQADLEDLRALEHARNHVVSHGRSLQRMSQVRDDAVHTLVSLQSVVRSTLDMFQVTGYARDVGLHVDMGAEVLYVDGIRTQLEQCLLNLLQNAFDAFDGRYEGATIWLRVEVLDGGRRARLTIEDNGAGMTPEVQARLFEPFFTTKSPERGTGLGMAVVRQIIESHGGQIAVDTAVSRGTRVHVLVPTTAAHHAAAAPAASSPNPGSQP